MLKSSASKNLVSDQKVFTDSLWKRRNEAYLKGKGHIQEFVMKIGLGSKLRVSRDWTLLPSVLRDESSWNLYRMPVVYPSYIGHSFIGYLLGVGDTIKVKTGSLPDFNTFSGMIGEKIGNWNSLELSANFGVNRDWAFNPVLFIRKMFPEKGH